MAPVEGFNVGVGYDQAEAAKSFTPLPQGPYTVVIEEIKDAGKSQKGNQKYEFKAKIQNPPQTTPPPGAAGQPQQWPTHVYIRMNSDAKTVPFWKTLFTACGMKWTGTNINPNLLQGKKLIVEVVQKPYNGEMRNDIKAGGFFPAKS